MKHYLIYIWVFLGIFVASCTKPKFVTDSSNPSRKELGQQSEFNFTEGMKNYILGRFADAQSFFQKAQMSPENPAVNYMLAQSSLGLNKTSEALEYGLKALKGQPKNKYYYILVAQIYESQQNYAEAIKVYKNLIEQVPGTEEYNYELASDYLHNHNYEEALKSYGVIEETYGKSPEITRQKQQILVKNNKLPEAIAEGEALIKAFPDELEYKLVQAELMYSNNKMDDAIRLLEEVVKADPQESSARLQLFDIYKSKGKEEKSLEQLDYIFNSHEIDLATKLAALEELVRVPAPNEKVVHNALKYADLLTKYHSTDAKAFIAAGDVYMMAEKKELAWEKYVKAKQLGLTDFNSWNKLILLDSELNKVDSMLAHADLALETFPNQAVLWLYKGSAYLQKKDDAKALESLEEGKKLSSNNVALKYEFNVRLGDVYNNLKEYKKSDAAFEEALLQDPNNDHVLNNYSYFLSLRKEKLDQAKEMSEKLIKAHPDEPTYLDTYAWVLYVMKNYAEAKKYLEIAVSKSNNGTIVEHYGDALFQLGDKEKALMQWKKAKNLGETSDLIDKKIKDQTLYE